MSHILSSILSIVIAIFFILLGIVGILIPLSPEVRLTLSNFIQNESVMIFLFGLGCLLISTTIIIHFMMNSGKRHYEIRTESHSFDISESLFESYLNTYWKQLFPGMEVPNKVTLKKNTIHVAADLPFVPETDQKILLERIEKDLSDIFCRMLGYRNEFIISVTFENEPAKNHTLKKPS